MKKTVQKFIGDALLEVIKTGKSPSGILKFSPQNDSLTIHCPIGQSDQLARSVGSHTRGPFPEL
jgi:hypothetical protein